MAPPLLTAGRVSFNSHPRGRPPRMFQLKSLGCDDEPRPVALPAASSCQQLPAPLGMILGMILQRFFGLVNWKTVCELENHGKSPCYSWENSLFRAMFNRYVSHYQRVNHMILGAPAQLMLLGHPFFADVEKHVPHVILGLLTIDAIDFPVFERQFSTSPMISKALKLF